MVEPISLHILLTLECGFSFFCCFLKDTLVKKNDIKKKEHFLASIKTRNKKCTYTLRKKQAYFWKIPPSGHTHAKPPAHHNRTRFCQNLPKKRIKLPFFIAISYIFKYFSKSPYVSRIWFANNASKIPLQFYFYFFCKITIYKANLMKKNVWC